MGLAETIQQRIDYLFKIIAIKEKALADAPEGTLKIHSRRIGASYYMVKDENKDGIYLPKHDLEKARMLAQKSYDKQVLRAAKSELTALERLYNFYDKTNTMEDCYSRLSPLRSELVSPVVLTDEQYIEEWKKKHPPRVTGKPNTVNETKKGDLVRSRAEILIADRLLTAGYTYQYETPLLLDGVVYHPDFCVLNLRRRKTFWWEHLGMMDDSDYLEDNIQKLNVYARNGIIIGKNLIITMETLMNPFNTSQIDQMIQTFLV